MSEELAEGLKPCPFCGSEAKLFEQFPYKVYCSKTGCICSSPQVVFANLCEAVKAWNTRPLSGAGLNEDWTETIDVLLEDLDKVKALIGKGSDNHA